MLKNKYLWFGVLLGLIVGDIVGVALFHDKNDAAKASASLVATTTPFHLTLTSQKAGNAVFVSEALVATSTWLAVREHNGDLFGRILGARRVDGGDTKGVTVELLRPTTAYLMYAVVLYEDNGDNVFDNKVDPLVEKDGQPVAYPFSVDN
jgi:hypothetical protein